MNTIEKALPWNRFQLKIAVSYIFIIALMLALLNTYPFIAAQNIIFQNKRSSMLGHANTLSAALADIDILTETRVGWVMQNWEENTGFRTLVTDEAGRILYDNSVSDNQSDRFLLLPEVIRALHGFDVFHSRRDGDSIHAKAAVPIVIRGQTAGSVYLYDEDAGSGAFLTGIRRDIGMFSLSVFVLVFVLSGWLSFILARRLGRLSRAMRRVREGEYGYHAAGKGRDELAQLERDFNSLSDRLLQNESQRRQFVSDASHELKTPLASVRLLADSVLQTNDMDPDLIREFVGDMRDEIERLTRMTDKLLKLPRLDAADPRHTSVDLQHVIAATCKALNPLAENAGVALHFPDETPCTIHAEEDDCFQIIYNLIENAIKYNNPGGNVCISLNTAGETAELTVKDTGSGIDADELKHIFNRFYRVDKARKQGGVGLGLSIAEAAVKRCRGDISVSSEPGSGSVFTVRFPKAP
jgi:signal transduction histidine kinase